MAKKSKEQISFNMSRIRAKGSEMEKLLGKNLWRSNLRYRKHYPVFGKPDFVLVDEKIAIFCDSSFWHGYKMGKTKRHKFKSNQKFWKNKIKRNIERDKEVNNELKKQGWEVVRFWDFDIKKNPQKCADKIASMCVREKTSERKRIFLPPVSFDEFITKDSLNRIDWNTLSKVMNGVQFDVVDFFSGCGGMSYGFHKLGKETGKFRHIGAFDIDKHANKTFATNFGYIPNTINLADAKLSEIKAALNKRRNPQNKLIVIGCAPCQGFSTHRKKDKRIDPRNTLIEKFAEIVVGLEAEVLIMENVPELLSKKYFSHYSLFKKTLENHGYRLNTRIVNMAEYGVPQERFRAVILAAKQNMPIFPAPVFERGQFRTVRDAIAHLPPLKASQKCNKDPMHLTSKHRPETIAVLKQVPRDGGSRPPGVGPKCLDKVAGFYDVYGRLSWNKPAITITARCRTPSCGRFAHPEQDRGLSVREAGLLQGFPNNFVFEGPFDDKFKQIGNAVPPPFSVYLAGHLLALLGGKNFADSDKFHRLVKEPLTNSFSSVIASLKNARPQPALTVD